MGILALMLLATVPMAGWWYTRARAPQHTWLVMGLAIGSVIVPFSRGLWAASYYIMPAGIVTVVPAVFFSLFFGAPGFRVAEWLGVGRNASFLYVDLLNGGIWAAVYGAVGFLVDRSGRPLKRRAS